MRLPDFNVSFKSCELIISSMSRLDMGVVTCESVSAGGGIDELRLLKVGDWVDVLLDSWLKLGPVARSR